MIALKFGGWNNSCST